MAGRLVTLLNLLTLALNSPKESFMSRNGVLQEDARFIYYPGIILSDYKLPNVTKTPIKILIHDWQDNPESPWMSQMFDAMGRKKRWHVITLNYSPATKPPNSAAVRPDWVASRLANFTIEATRTNGMPFKCVHFIGHGRGAHIAVLAARQIARRIGKRIYRLTALDPTIDPLEANAESSAAHRGAIKDCVRFLDVIHTNGGDAHEFLPIGHVDFYPNGGRSQPGCCANRAQDVDEINRCNHNRACEYFAASVVDAHAFRAFDYQLWCDYVEGKLEKLTPQPMGIGATECMHGAYYLETQACEPYILPYNSTRNTTCCCNRHLSTHNQN